MTSKKPCSTTTVTTPITGLSDSFSPQKASTRHPQYHLPLHHYPNLLAHIVTQSFLDMFNHELVCQKFFCPPNFSFYISLSCCSRLCGRIFEGPREHYKFMSVGGGVSKANMHSRGEILFLWLVWREKYCWGYELPSTTRNYSRVKNRWADQVIEPSTTFPLLARRNQQSAL